MRLALSILVSTLFSSITPAASLVYTHGMPNGNQKAVLTTQFPRASWKNTTFSQPPHHTLSKRGRGQWDPEMQHASDLLDTFVGLLKEFVFKRSFDVLLFDLYVEKLQDNLSYMTNVVNSLPFSGRLGSQLCFATHMVQVMEESVPMLKYYATSHLPGRRWLYKMIELNVRLLTMHNSYGALDRSINRYAEKLLGFWRRMRMWEHRFTSLGGVPLEMQLLFEDQRSQAADTIDSLWGQVPDEYR
ncbi:hypothetical protein JCM33374_g2238 [Metschnikowia sp. JCM 33374]|nr:hypothetical protein JCM33374_g2238 [Metschnikowia sp. JCM 33374]